MIPFPQDSFLPLLHLALQEDIPHSDITSTAVIPPDLHAKAHILAKQDGVLAGLPSLPFSFGETCLLTFLKEEGAVLRSGDIVAEIEGPARTVLSRERLSLNFLQRLSGIATLTNSFVKAVEGSSIRILGTRKTAPGYRALDRYAIVLGGGVSHRASLSDQVLLKENHFYFGKTLGLSFEQVLQKALEKHSYVQVEVETFEEAQCAAHYTDHILLDDMDIPLMQRCIQAIRQKRPHAHIEASGGITLEKISTLRSLGLDRISLGCLTHSFKAFDFSLIFQSSSLLQNS
jgi:nicotinate-nucleotide pyrophosphorylase (carboxylating)